MTDRYAGFIVTLENPKRDDDSGDTIAAILQIKGVISVKPIVADAFFCVAKEQVRFELQLKLQRILREDSEEVKVG